MEKQDFERLKAKLGDEFEILNDSVEDNYKFFVVKKKDIWEGVGYFSFNDYHMKITSSQTDQLLFNSNGDSFWKNECKPSTESAYIDQLKKKAFERFGEIQEGDRFDFTEVGFPSDKSRAVKTGYSNEKWEYDKELDRLYLHGFSIYQAGKWATKLPKRVEVGFDHPNSGMVANNDFHTIEYTFNIKRTGKDYPNPIEAGKFLAKQLEAYLNGEVE